jgi:hypothetical protein
MLGSKQVTFKFKIVEDGAGRRVYQQHERPFNWQHFLHVSANKGWIPKENAMSYSPKRFDREMIILNLIDGKKDFALEIEDALRNYGFKGVLTIDDKIILTTIPREGD